MKTTQLRPECDMNDDKLDNPMIGEGAQAPSITATAFDCPNCGNYSAQQWYACDAHELEFPPLTGTGEQLEAVQSDEEIDEDSRKLALDRLKKLATKRAFLKTKAVELSVAHEVGNLSVSKCSSCGELAVWVNDRIVWPL